MSYPARILLLSLCLLAPAVLPASARPKKAETPAAAPAEKEEAVPDADPLYRRDLQAYRGLLRREELDKLEEDDPAVGLWLGPKAPGEAAAGKLFAALPDDLHATLQREGYLKWKLDTLPPQARKWVLDAAKALNSHGEGPFPIDEKSAKGVPVTVGFVRIDPGAQPLYSFFIQTPGAHRPAWVTLVRAVGLFTKEYHDAHQLRMEEVLPLDDSPAVPAKSWVNPKELPKPAPPPPVKPEPLTDENAYWAAVRAYRGDQGSLSADPLVAKRAASTDVRDKAVNAFFARLPDRDHRAFLQTGRLRWRVEQLSKEQRKLLEPLIREYNRQPRLTPEEPYSLLPFGGTQVGFTLVRMPDQEQPCVSWWMASRANPTPVWITMINGAALRSPGYYQAHLEQLLGGN